MKESKFRIIFLFVIVLVCYVTYSSLKSNQVRLYEKQNETITLLHKKSDNTWFKHSNLPEPCYGCHGRIFNRIDKQIYKYRTWQELHNMVGCKGGFEKTKGRKMPCLKVEPLMVKSLFRNFNEEI